MSNEKNQFATMRNDETMTPESDEKWVKDNKREAKVSKGQE